MTNNLSSSDLTLLIICIILMVIIIACAGIIIFLRIKKRKGFKQSQVIEDYRYEPLNKEIGRYQKLREQYKKKLIDQDYLDHDKTLNDMKAILDAELQEYKAQELVKIEQDIQKQKDVLLRHTILDAMQPLHLKVINEASVHYLPIADKFKPLLIGKKGRNIKYLNEVTNCNINVDKDSPYVEISCPNPLDKQIAINTINHLLKSEAFDINAIENVYHKECKLMTKECYETGKHYLGILNIDNSNPTLCEYVGRLKYRWSFSQNVLEHCYETALICERLAMNLGLDPVTAKAVGFFHDIGKCMDYESKYNHVATGVKIAKECNLPLEVVNGILKHHRNNCTDDYVLLVRCADAWSAARKGARHMPTEKQDQTIKMVEAKLRKIKGILSFKVDMDGNDIKIIFVPVLPDKKNYLDIKYEIIKTIKKDVRLNKHHITIIQ